eukprot:1154605-Pelagomonas_calceolata.AAC.11
MAETHWHILPLFAAIMLAPFLCTFLQDEEEAGGNASAESQSAAAAAAVPQGVAATEGVVA